MAERALDLGAGLELWKVPIEEAREQDINARSMTKEQFDRLTATIGRDQRMEQLPFLALVDDHLEIVSGHHRVRSSRQAGLGFYWALVDTTGLSRDQIAAKQLAHNSIEGEDDPELVKRIFSAIADVDARLEAFIDPAMLEIQIPRVTIDEIDMGLKFETVIISFIPFEREYFEATVKLVEREITGTKAEHAWLAEHHLYEEWQRLAYRIIEEYDIRTMSTIMHRIAELAQTAMGVPPPPAEWVSLRDIVGTATIPVTAAEVIKKAIERMENNGDVGHKNRWQCLEFLAADYLAGDTPDAMSDSEIQTDIEAPVPFLAHAAASGAPPEP